MTVIFVYPPRCRKASVSRLVCDVAAGVLEHFAQGVVEGVGSGELFEAYVATVTPIVIPFGGDVDALIGGFFGAEFFVAPDRGEPGFTAFAVQPAAGDVLIHVFLPKE